MNASRSGRTIYFNGKALKGTLGGMVSGSHYDLETGQEYWVSGVKKNDQDRHWAGGRKVMVALDLVDEYLALIGEDELDSLQYGVFDPISTDPQEFYELETKPFES